MSQAEKTRDISRITKRSTPWDTKTNDSQWQLMTLLHNLTKAHWFGTIRWKTVDKVRDKSDKVDIMG